MAEVLAPAFLGASGMPVSGLGLGCSHIASFSTRPDARQIARLLDQAWDKGIRFFDTADIYGQGHSECRLAGIAARPGAMICTKAGLALSTGQSALRLVKPILRPLLLRLPRARKAAATARAVSERHDLHPARLVNRLEDSLRRLRQEQVAVFLLHSPPRAALADGRLFETLDQIRDRGLARLVGVSCQTLEDAHWVLRQARVGAVQVALCAPALDAAGAMLDEAERQGAGVIAREVLRGAADPAEALPPLLRDPRVHVTLTGTTDPAHLAQNIAIAAQVR